MALGLGAWSRFPHAAEVAAEGFVRHGDLVRRVLRGATDIAAPEAPERRETYGTAIASACGAVVLAAMALSGRKRRLAVAARPLTWTLERLVRGAHALHSGKVGDYVALLTLGAAIWLAVLWAAVR